MDFVVADHNVWYVFLAWFMLSCFLAPIVGMWIERNK